MRKIFVILSVLLLCIAPVEAAMNPNADVFVSSDEAAEAFTLYEKYIDNNDTPQALKYLKIAADGGHPKAQELLERYRRAITSFGFDPDAFISAIITQDTGQRFTVIGMNIKVRTAPDSASSESARLNAGDSVMVLATSGSWMKVKASGGISGWVMGKYLTQEQDN